MFILTYGTKVFDEPVDNGITRRAYCSKCNTMVTLYEFEGQKKWHLYNILPIKNLGKPFHFLKCLQCNTTYSLDYNVQETSGANPGVFRDLDSTEKNQNMREAIIQLKKLRPDKVSFVSCGHCKLHVVFDYDNDDFFYCKKDVLGINIDTDKPIEWPKCPKCKNNMELFQLKNYQELCPICSTGLLSVKRVKK